MKEWSLARQVIRNPINFIGANFVNAPASRRHTLDCAIEDEKLLTQDKDLCGERYSRDEQGPEK